MKPILLALLIGLASGAAFWLAAEASRRFVLRAGLLASSFAALVLVAVRAVYATRGASAAYIIGCGVGAAIVASIARQGRQEQRYDLPDRDRRGRNRRVADRSGGGGGES